MQGMGDNILATPRWVGRGGEPSLDGGGGGTLGAGTTPSCAFSHTFCNALPLNDDPNYHQRIWYSEKSVNSNIMLFGMILFSDKHF